MLRDGWMDGWMDGRLDDRLVPLLACNIFGTESDAETFLQAKFRLASSTGFPKAESVEGKARGRVQDDDDANSAAAREDRGATKTTTTTTTTMTSTTSSAALHSSRNDDWQHVRHC